MLRIGHRLPDKNFMQESRVPEMVHSFLRNDIVGRYIANVLQTPWMTQDGISACSVFLVLENGASFQLDGLQDSMDQSPIPCIHLEGADLVPADLGADEADFMYQPIL